MFKKPLTAAQGREVPCPKKQEWRGGLIDTGIGNVLGYMLEKLP